MGNSPCNYALRNPETDIWQSINVKNGVLVNSLPDGKQDLRSLFSKS